MVGLTEKSYNFGLGSYPHQHPGDFFLQPKISKKADSRGWGRSRRFSQTLMALPKVLHHLKRRDDL